MNKCTRCGSPETVSWIPEYFEDIESCQNCVDKFNAISRDLNLSIFNIFKNSDKDGQCSSCGNGGELCTVYLNENNLLRVCSSCTKKYNDILGCTRNPLFELYYGVKKKYRKCKRE